MKKITTTIYRSVLVLLALAGATTIARSQSLVFYFVAPNSVITGNFHVPADNANCPAGYAKVQVTAANAATFNAVAPTYIKYVYTQLQPGTALRNNVNLLFQNSGGLVPEVQYWLADDRTGFTVSAANNGGMFMPYPATNPKYVWPAAGNYDPGTHRYIGVVGLGEHHMATNQSRRVGGIHAVDEVVLHETSHTQFISGSKWEGFGGNSITYGADGMHYSRGELLADQEGALNEGLATFYGFIMNDSALQSLQNYYNQPDYRYFVEGRSFLAGQRDLYSIAERRRSALVRYVDGRPEVQHYANGDEITIFSYRWRDVPGWYLLFNESISTLFFSYMRNQTYQNTDTALSMIRFTAQSMSQDRRKRFLTYACNRLGLAMEQYNNSAAGRADTTRTSSLFPFAVLDLLTHFGMSDADYQADYRRNYADRDPRAFAEYFIRRNAIKALVQGNIDSSPIQFNQALQRIKDYCRQPANIL